MGGGQSGIAQSRRAGKPVAMLADAFSALPGELELLDPAPVEAVAADGTPLRSSMAATST